MKGRMGDDWVDGWIAEMLQGQTDGWIYPWTDARINGWMNEWMGG